MRILLLFGLLFSAAACAQEPANNVGLIYPQLPAGLTEKGGGLARGTVHADGLWYLFIEGDGKSMVWLNREVGKTVDGKGNRPIWKVLDTLQLPSLRKGEAVHYGNDIACSYTRKADESIIAIGKWKWRKNRVGGYVQNVRLAWRIHPTLDRFEVISPAKVGCRLDEDRD